MLSEKTTISLPAVSSADVCVVVSELILDPGSDGDVSGCDQSDSDL